MAGVDHAYQYSVEVKSRFSLFLNDSLNEDPDLLISKLKTERVERSKKDKVHGHVPSEATETVKSEVTVHEEKSASQPAKAARSVKPPPVEHDEAVAPALKSPSGDHSAPIQRGRGGRGFGRARGRGMGSRPIHDDASEPAGDLNHRDPPYEPRGRGRGRARGGFGRGRGSAYTDHREYDRQPHESTDQRRPYRRDVPADSQETEVITEAPVENVNQEPTDGEPQEVELKETEENVEVEEEPKSYTLEEYKALRSSKPAVTLNTKNARKANDGKDVFANMVAHRKIVEVQDEDYEEVQREQEEEHDINIDITFTDRNQNRGRGRGGFGRGGFERGRGVQGFRGDGRPRGFRGNRGAFRGEGRGRGFRGGMSSDHGAPPVILSDQDFPSLK